MILLLSGRYTRTTSLRWYDTALQATRVVNDREWAGSACASRRLRSSCFLLQGLYVHEISHAFPKLEIRSLLVRARCGSGATRVAEHVARVGTPVRPARQTPPYLLPRLKARLLVYWACLYERAVIRKPRRRLLGPSTPP
jgi:hypothetical protein